MFRFRFPRAKPWSVVLALIVVSSTAFGQSLDTPSTENERFWVDARYHYMWIQGVRVPALVTTSPDGTLQPDAGVLPAAEILAGDERLLENGRPGGGLELGYWLNDFNDQALVIDWFSVGDGANRGDFDAFSTGDPILARPFLNVQSGIENAELVAFPSVLDGRVRVSTFSEFHSAAASLRHNWLSGTRGRIDWLFGYRYLRFREALAVEENLVSTAPSGLIQQGTTIDVLDRFVTENDFHGADIGMVSEWYYDWLTLEWLAKLGLGNVNQVVTIDGSTQVTTPGDPTVTTAGGLLAQPTNMGTLSDNTFTFVPQVGLMARIALTPTCDLSAGYSLLYITDVARVGSHIDRGVNPSQIGGGTLAGAARPTAVLGDTSMWSQGLSVGLTVWR